MKYYFVDLFCGFGGTSYGINNSKLRANNIAEVVMCVNHDKNAIASHQLNHPEALHFVEDIRILQLQPMVDLVNDIRKKDRTAIICLWASLECTNHSNAKGGMSRDADSRTLAQHLFRYLDAVSFDMVWIENVREFKDWGPLMHKVINNKLMYDTKGNPIMVPVKESKGVDYESWVKDMKAYGFEHAHKLVNSADFGARTSRNRLFVQFVKSPLKIYWPSPTHDKLGRNGLEKWLPVRPLLQLNKTGESIFGRKKPLADNTYDRILRGVTKHKPQFFIKYYGTGDNTQTLDTVSPTLTTKDRMSLVSKEQHLSFAYSSEVTRGMDEPCATLTTKPKGDLVSAFLIDSQYKNNGTSIDVPCPTLIAKMDKKPRYLVTQESSFLEHYYNRDNTFKELDEPLTALTTNPRQRIMTQVMGEPVRITLRDSMSVKALKTYMNENGISDIKMRGLFVSEMLQIMGFPANYKIVGTMTEAKKFIGNAVETQTAKTLIYESYRKNIQNTIR